MEKAELLRRTGPPSYSEMLGRPPIGTAYPILALLILLLLIDAWAINSVPHNDSSASHKPGWSLLILLLPVLGLVFWG